MLEERLRLQSTDTHLRTIKHIRGLLVEDDGLPVDVPGQDLGGEGQDQEGAEVGDHDDDEETDVMFDCLSVTRPESNWFSVARPGFTSHARTVSSVRTTDQASYLPLSDLEWPADWA